MALAHQFTEDDYDFLAEDLEAYSEAALVIRTKSGALEPFRFNRAQRVVNERLDAQLERTRQVRALVLKARQEGISTLIGGRFYHKTTNRRGFRTHILTHHDDATTNLFEMIERFHEHCPEDLRPETGKANAKEMMFPGLESGYKVGTAGGRAVGRSSTIQLFHGSEFGFWPNAEENLAGILEAVPDEPDTEIVLESTANKPGDAFHRMWKAAKAGQSRFIAIFLAWFEHEEYATEPPAGWEAPPAFKVYQAAHDLTDAQLYWAWEKNRDMASFRGLSADELCPAFKREYPATDEEAFEAAGDDLTRAIPREWVKIAQARWIANKDKPRGPMTGMGLDVAQGGEDRTVLAPIHGLRIETLIAIPGNITTDGPAVAAAVLRHARDKPTIAVDLGGGWGGGALSHLKTLNQDAIGVNPAEKSAYVSKKEQYRMRNMRAELYWRFHDALDPETGEDVELPPDDEMVEELIAPSFEVTPSGLQIESKPELQKAERLGRSPDKADAVLLAWHAARINAALRARRRAEEQQGSDGSFWST